MFLLCVRFAAFSDYQQLLLCLLQGPDIQPQRHSKLVQGLLQQFFCDVSCCEMRSAMLRMAEIVASWGQPLHVLRRVLCCPSRRIQAISGKKLQEQASAAYDDGLTHPEVNCLKALGAGGVCVSNIERDLHGAIRKMYGVELTAATVSVKRLSRRGKELECRAGVVYAHEMWALISAQPQRFAQLMLPADGAPLSRFWDAVRIVFQTACVFLVLCR